MSCIRFRRPLPHGIMTSQENQAVAVSYMPARELHLRVPKAASASPAAAGKSQSGPLTLPGQEWQNSNPGQQTAEAHLPIWTRNWFCPVCSHETRYPWPENGVQVLSTCSRVARKCIESPLDSRFNSIFSFIIRFVHVSSVKSFVLFSMVFYLLIRRISFARQAHLHRSPFQKEYLPDRHS